MTTENKFFAGLYLRLSQEDGDKVESDSIANQRELGLSFLKNHPEIELVDTFVDDTDIIGLNQKTFCFKGFTD